MTDNSIVVPINMFTIFLGFIDSTFIKISY
jgi:hypothetical protein